MASSATIAGTRTYGGAAGQHARGATAPAHPDPSDRAVAVTDHAGLHDLPRDRHPFFPAQRWFAVQCQARREQTATIQLRNQGFRVFLPLRLKTSRHARRRETRQVPFFPGYTFIALDPERERWRNVNGTFGVQRIVTAGGEGRPAPLPRGLIEALHGEADERGCLHHEELLRVGQAVRILGGPLDDRMGELIGLDGAGRVRLLIELLGGQRPVTLSRDKVVAAG